jgi:fructose-1-phosphate kinase PfkB-like protein
MDSRGRIITIGLSPAWDVSCRGRDLDWGRHAELDEQVIHPAGKALNVSYALAWLGRQSIAAGLWGREDYGRMKTAIARLDGRILARMTPADGATRHNITVVDTRRHREMHLRRKSELASERPLRRLNADLRELVRGGDTCVFAGAMPGGDLRAFRWLAHAMRRARIVVDTHGPALAAVVDEGLGPWSVPTWRSCGLTRPTVASHPLPGGSGPRSADEGGRGPGQPGAPGPCRDERRA